MQLQLADFTGPAIISAIQSAGKIMFHTVGDTGTPQFATLDAFLSNFCALTPGQSPDAGGLVRSVMTQPGVYFTLDAPYVSIIGLYSNVLDGPGVISSPGGKFPLVDDQARRNQPGPQRSKGSDLCSSPL